MNQYEELKQEIKDLTETVKELAVEVGNLKKPMVYNYIDKNMPEWARKSVQWAVDNGIIKGDGNGLALTDEKLWQTVVMHRLSGILGNHEKFIREHGGYVAEE